MGDERQPADGQTFAAAMMVGDGGGGSRETVAGKKRKASSADALAAMRREPRRGLGVAELERIRVALEVAERCYAVPTLTAPAPQPPPALPPTALAVVHGAGLAAVGNGGAAVHQLQMPTTGYFAPYYVAAQQYESFTRLFTSGGHPSPHQNGRHADQIQSAVTTALPAAGQAPSSESSSSAYQRRQSHRRRAQAPRQQQPTGQTMVPIPAAPKVAFVDLVDSDDDDGGGGHVEELDLELRL